MKYDWLPCITYEGKRHKIVKNNPEFGHNDGWCFYSLKTGLFAFFLNATDKWMEDNYEIL